MEVVTSSSTSGRRCPFCHDALPKLETTTDCPSCGAAHHPACWDEGDGCATCRTARRDGAPIVRDGGYDVLHVRRQRIEAPAPRPLPDRDRLRVLDTPHALMMRLPLPGSCFMSAFLCVWLCGWLGGEVFAVNALLAGGTPLSVRAFLLVWTAFWTLGGALAARALLASLFGGEWWLRLTRDELSIGRWALGIPFGRGLSVAPADVRAVRAAGACVIVEHAEGEFTWTEPTPAEAERIVELVRARLDMKA